MRILRNLAFTLTAAALFSGSAFAQHSVTLTWTPPAAQAGVVISAYNVYRCDIPGCEQLGVNHFPGTSATATNFTDSTVVAGKTYYYKVSAWCGSCGPGGVDGLFSNEVKAVIPAAVMTPGPPTVTTVVIN
jgi:hypothetical protein